MAPPPRLTFFCELDERALAALMSRAALIDDLVALGAAVSMACVDHGSARAEVVRALNRRGVPVSAWLVAPRARGYFATVDNAGDIAAAYRALRAWAAREELDFEGVGIDVEMDIEHMDNLAAAPWRLALPALRGALRGGDTVRAEADYAGLIARIRADGHRVDSYQLPPVVDARAAGSSLMARAFGMLRLQADREVLMLYSSALPLGGGWLASYGRGAQAIGVGVAGGGAVVVPPITWDELARDLRIAAAASPHVYVFSLEGCVERGFLDRLRHLDWNEAPAPPLFETRLLDVLRAVLRAGLRLEAQISRLLATVSDARGGSGPGWARGARRLLADLGAWRSPAGGRRP